jgi:site-specific DNA recombinase
MCPIERTLKGEIDMRVALYPRVSGHEQEDNYSIPEQIDRMKKYCESRDWMVYKIYTDSVQTGATMDRPGLQSMIKDIEDGKIDMVLVYKLDRLSRSQKDTLYLIEDVFDKHDVGFTSMTENFDTSSPFGKAVLGVLAVFAQLERDKITERTTMGKKARAAEGKWHGSKWVPIGYNYEDGLLQVNEYEKMQILEIADLFLQRVPVRTIANMMTEKGYKHKYGEWDAKAIKRVLQNPVNLGLIKDGDTLHPGLHDAIIEQETYDAIQVIMNERKEQYGSNARPHKSLLAGFLFCKHCGGRYARQTNSDGRQYYSCYSRNKSQKKMIKDPNCKNKNYRSEELDIAILLELNKLAIDPEYVDHVRQNKPKNDVNEKIKSITSEIEKIDLQISKMMDLYALGSIDMDVISNKVTDLNKTKASLQKEIASLDVPDEDEMTVEEIQSLASMMNDEKLSLADKRSIIQSLIYYIEIDGENIVIHWKF